MIFLIIILVLFLAVNAWIIVHEKVVVFNFTPYRNPRATLSLLLTWLKDKIVKILKLNTNG